MKLTFIACLLLVTLRSVAQEPTPVNGVNMLKNSKWPSQPNGKTIIPVSWENPSAANVQERKWVEDAIKATWENYANIDFIDWTQSTPTSRGLRIRIDPDGWPHTEGLGTRLDGKKDGLILTFDFSGQFKCAGFSREECIKFTTVHEFGHVLGLAHEQNRKDCLCREASQGTDGDFYVTPCDLESVMNYCNTKWNNYGMLSDHDIIGIQVVYGKAQKLLPSFDLDEIRLIPCSENVRSKINFVKDLVIKSSQLRIKTFTEETQPVPQKATDNIPNTVTIRYFDSNDEAKAFGIRTLLVAEGYDKSSVFVEDMTKRMENRPNYIEIWAKEPKTIVGPIYIDEIRFVPISNAQAATVKEMKTAITGSSIGVKIFTQETKDVPQRAVNNLPNTITIRYFHPDDEGKAFELGKLLSADYDNRLISVENMTPRMVRTYPNYFEVWTKQ